jgi:hypothetical protein
VLRSRGLNLRSALAVARDTAARFPSARNALAEAALLVALAQLHSEDALLHGFDDDRRDWLISAARPLNGIAAKELEEAGVDLRPIGLEILSRTYLLRGESELAREILRDAPSPVLAQRALARRLVAVTRDALRYEPGEILARVGAKLAQLPTPNGDRETAERELQNLIQAELARRAEPYRISLPRSTP